MVGKPVDQNRQRSRRPSRSRETERQRQGDQRQQSDSQDQGNRQSGSVAAEPPRRRRHRRHRRQDQRRHQPQQQQLFGSEPNHRQVPRSGSCQHGHGGEPWQQPKSQGQHDQHIERPAHRLPDRLMNPLERPRQAGGEHHGRERGRRDPALTDQQDQGSTQRTRAGQHGDPPADDQTPPVQPTSTKQQDRQHRRGLRWWESSRAVHRIPTASRTPR